MAAPAAALRLSYSFRDAKGQVGRMKMLIGGATAAAIITAYNAGAPLLQAISNGHVTEPISYTRDYTYGAVADYLNVEDKAVFTFRNPLGALSRFQLPAPKATIFENDQETVNETNTDVEAWVAWVQANVYATITDTAPLALVGGLRLRRKYQRRMNIWTLDPTLGEIGE